MSDVRGTVKLDGDGRVAQELICARCGHNLHGMKLTNVCPACGMPLNHAPHPPFDRVRWLRRLAEGATVGAIAMVLVAVGIAVAAAAVLDIIAIDKDRLHGAIIVLFAISVPLSVWASWILSTPDTGRDGVESASFFLARLGMCGGLFAFMCAIPSEHGGPLALASIGLSVGLLSLSIHMSHIATWLSHLRLASCCRVVGVGLAAGVFGVGFLLVMFMDFEISRFQIGNALLFFCAFAVLTVPGLLWFRQRCIQASKREQERAVICGRESK